MASKLDIKKLSGVSDDRWTTRDKITQYRGLIQLYGRDRKKLLESTTRQRKKQLRQIHNLKKECKSLRMYLDDALKGDRQRIRSVLHRHKKFQLAFGFLQSDVLLESLDHVIHKRRRELDKLRYNSKYRMELFKNYKCELSELEDHKLQEEDYTQRSHTEQIILNHTEEVNVKYNAAASIKISYENMLHILRKDSRYFDVVLNALHNDSFAQGSCVLRATELGQLATEELANTRDEYKVLERQVKKNMRERDKAVKRVRRSVDELYLKCKMLTRVEVEPEHIERGRTASDVALTEELKELEMIMAEMKKITLVSTYDDIFPRMEDQFKQNRRLIHQKGRNEKLRDDYLHMKNNAEVMLSQLEHTVVHTTFVYKENKAKVLCKINVKSTNLQVLKDAIELQGQTMVLVRVALQTLYEILGRVQSDDDDERGLFDEQTDDDPMQHIPPSLEEDALKLLRLISDRMEKLIDSVPEDLTEQKAEEAKQMYQREIIDKLNLAEFGEVDEYDIPLVGEMEADDASVLSREVLKLRTKRVVDLNERNQDPTAIAERPAPAASKHVRWS